MDDDLVTSHQTIASSTFSNIDTGTGRLSPVAPFSTSIPDSPSTSTFLRTAETLDGLTRQLEYVNDDSRQGGRDTNVNERKEDIENGLGRCCCGSSGGCSTWIARDATEAKLKLSGEIGNALLQRYEALEKKYQREVEKFEHQLEVKRTALAESVRRVNNLEKANTTHLQKYAEMSRKNEALEKRYTQAMHTQTLTQQSLTHVRSELTSLRRSTTTRHASGVGIEERLLDAEKRYEEAREAMDSESRKARDEVRKRRRAEARIAELEGQLKLATKEVEDVREARAKDAQELLANAKDRLAILHTELSETFTAEIPSDVPEYQRTLEDLVASNALLRHDTAQLTHTLAESREELRMLRDENDELRAAAGVAGRVSPDLSIHQHLASELSQSQRGLHSRTESSPIVGTFPERHSWARMSIAGPSRTGGMSAWEHHRRSSMAPSFASTSTTDGLTSPGLGMGPIGEFGGSLIHDESVVASLSPPLGDGNESPKPVFRTSPSGGIAYVLNGVPKGKVVQVQKPPLRRAPATDRPKPTLRSFSSQGVEPIAEWPSHQEEGTQSEDTAPLSPAALEYFRAADAARKRRSLILARNDAPSPQESANYSPNASLTMVDQSSTAEMPSPRSEGALPSPGLQKKPQRKTLLLLTKHQAVQTDRVDIAVQTEDSRHRTGASIASNETPPQPPAESETSSLHEPRAGVLLLLVDHLGKILTKLRQADVPTLNKRLKKQHLPGDVGHLSRSTMRNLQQEIAELRDIFRGPGDLGVLSRKEFSLLLKLLRDVFGELIDLQAIVNDVTIEPRLAKKLQKDAYRDDDDPDSQAKQGGGLGWIAAPITKFFVTPAGDGAGQEGLPSPRPGRGLEKSKMQAMPVKAAPKLQASTSATTTHVSVEFGGTGIVRRAMPAAPPPAQGPSGGSAIDGLPSSPQVDGQTIGRVASSSTEGNLAPPTVRQGGPGTLRPSKSRANRNELLGIFAGAARVPSPIGGEPWTVTGEHGTAQGPRPLRAVSSQYFGDGTIRARPSPDGQRQRLSAVVDAVIDTSADQLEGESVATPFEPPLLERTLRPRGLSDSSIRSTFVSHGNPSPSDRLMSASTVSTGPAPRVVATAYPSSLADRGVLASLASRFYPFRAVAPEPAATDPAESSRAESEMAKGVPIPSSSTTLAKPETTTQPARSPPRPIPVSPSKRTTSTNPVSPTTMSSSQTGLFGMLASSLAEQADHLAHDSDMGTDDLLRHGRLYGGGSGVRGRSARGDKNSLV
ncbi:hypothetical protein BCR39DRAFT_206519 [Naematelia encephala]|uniref:Uncharacterized protein n=1 Tax=Naematelia encephala TaxID=71784 RepID=A0A1Y2B0L2_9TREE|nr:hypothetical protein BCR39DRAFT_206519 [Naematelia encephala]